MADDKPRRVCRPRAATNKWDAEQRTALHVLCTHFNSFGWPLVTKAFNVLFEEHLSSRGFPDGLLEGSLKAQYAKSERNGKPQIWASICAQPATDEEWHRRIELTARIRTVLTALQTGAQNQPAVPRLGETATGAGRRQPATESPPDEPKTPLKRLSRFMLAESMVKRRKTDSGATSGSAMPRPADRPAQTAPASFVAEPPSTGRATSSVTSGTNTNIRVAVSVKIVANGKGAAHSQPAEPVTPPSTRSRKTPRSEQRLQDHTRRNALTLKLTDEEIARTKLPLAAVPQTLAHPPAPGLLYRYWDENSYGRNSETGFVAGRFMYNNLFPRTAPKCHELDDTDIENHLNRNKVASPFCSASNCLLWIVRLRLQEARRGVKQGRIALIDTDSLPADGVYHVKPLHKRIKPQFPFTNGAWRYDGTHEFIIWHEIPRHAVVHTFTIADLLALCQKTPAFSAMLRVETVSRKLSSLKKTTVLRLQDGQVALTPETVTVIARLCRFVGLTGRSPLKQLEHLVSDVIQGWKLTIPPLSSAEWASHATIWCHVLCGRATVPCLERELQLKMTFLHAVRAGLGEFNMLHSPVLIKRMRRKAHRVGLASPTSIIMDSVALATAAVLAYEREQEVRYEKASEAMRMLPAGVGDRRILLESDVESPCGGASGVGLGSEDEDEDEIVYDDDTVGL